MGADRCNRFGASLGRLLGGLDVPVVRAEEITVVPAFGLRRTYRLWLADGRCLKGRSFRTAVQAEVAWRIHAHLATAALARPLAREGNAMLEEWVDGADLGAGRLPADLLEQAGALLGALHACPPLNLTDLPFVPLGIEGWLNKTDENLGTLTQHGTLAAAEARRIRARLGASRPAGATLGVVHRDLCPENLILRPDGMLVSVDNGSLTVGAIEEDLARLHYRWPMAPAELEAFRAGYVRHRPPEGFQPPAWFWRVVVVVNSARARLGVSPSAAREVLASLPALLREAEAPPRAISHVPPRACSFSYRGLRIDLASNAPDLLVWLAEFLHPHFSSATGGATVFHVEHAVDPDRYQRLLDQSAGSACALIDCFVADGAFEQLELWQEDARGRLLHDRRAEAFVRVGPGRQPIEVVSRRDGARVRVTLLRIVRELALLQALRRGDLFLHAAAGLLVDRVGRRPTGVLIAGSKGSGKTTTLLGLLRRGGARFVANDRVLVEVSDPAPRARGLPTIIKVRPDSLRHLPGLGAPALGFDYRHYLALAECRAGSPLIEPPTRLPPSLSPAQFCQWLGVKAAPACSVDMIVLPVVDPAVSSFAWRRLEAAEAAPRIAASRFPGGPGGVASPVFAPLLGAGSRPAIAGEEACARLAARCWTVECRVGPAAFAQPGLWDALLAHAITEGGETASAGGGRPRPGPDGDNQPAARAPCTESPPSARTARSTV